MRANHDRSTRQLRNRLKITCMGLGLVRLLQDARRFDEAKTTLYALENGFDAAAVEPTVPTQECCKAVDSPLPNDFVLMGIRINHE